MEGVKIGAVDGYNGNMVPTSVTCTSDTQTCVRLEVDEMTSVYGKPDGELRKFAALFNIAQQVLKFYTIVFWKAC